ncbi:hypothetical protein RMATCC62417_17465 [Rhizopus microsporus]|nr:hypothetical protein RMATCC62417_17465 [Rhizopus microsporus]
MGLDENQHEIRRCTTKEYYHLTGFTVYTKKLQQEKDTAGITAIEAATPTAKTARNISFLRFADHMLSNMDRLFTFYGFSTAKYRFNLYQGKQRAPEMMVNMLLNGGAKYNRKKRFKKKNKKEKQKNKKMKRLQKNEKKKGKSRQQQNRRRNKWKPLKFKEEDRFKVPLVVFGNDMFGKDIVKLKGLRCGVAGIMWRCLKKREAADDLLVLPIDEFKTSRNCCRCETDSLDSVSGVKGDSVLVCKTCNTL